MTTKAAALLTLCLVFPGCQADRSADAVHGEPMEAIEGVDGTVVRYEEGVYRGGDITSQAGMEALKSLGVATVFSVTPTDDERAFAEQCSIRLVEVPFTKTGIPPETLPTYLQQLEDAEQPIYVHCHSGNNRGGTLLAAYRVHVQGWDHEQARAEFIALGGKDSEFPELMESIRPE